MRSSGKCFVYDLINAEFIDEWKAGRLVEEQIVLRCDESLGRGTGMQAFDSESTNRRTWTRPRLNTRQFLVNLVIRAT